MESAAELRERRAFECRLTPDRALRSLDEADAFLRDRGMLTRTTDCALPSLYEACHEEPYKAGGVGFATWPATKWPWFGGLTAAGHLCVAVHRGKNLLVSSETAAMLDPICRAEIDRMRAADPGWRALLDHLAVAGPSDIEDLRVELRLKRQELKALRSPLERCGAIVSRSLEGSAARATRTPASWPAGTRPTPATGPARRRPRRSAACWSPPSAPPCSLPNPNCAAGSPGSGTGPRPSWTTWSGPAASAAWTARSRPASCSDRGRVHEAGMVFRREYHPGLPLREQHPLAARQRERGPVAQLRP